MGGFHPVLPTGGCFSGFPGALVTWAWFSKRASILLFSLHPLSLLSFLSLSLNWTKYRTKMYFYYSFYQLNLFSSVRCSKKYMSGMFPTFLLSCSKHIYTHTHYLSISLSHAHTQAQSDFSFLKELSSNLFCPLLSIKHMKLHSQPHLHRSRCNFLDMSGQPACTNVPEQRVECAFCVQNMKGPDTLRVETQQTSMVRRKTRAASQKARCPSSCLGHHQSGHS